MEKLNLNRQPGKMEAANDNESDPQLRELEAALAANFEASTKSGDLHLANDSEQVSIAKTAYQNFLRTNPDVLRKALDTKANSKDAFQQQLYALAREVDAIEKQPTELAA
jgi:hypothetical protein